MRAIVVGLGIQGHKRRAVAGPEAVAAVDPANRAAEFRNASEVPLDAYDAALVCTPDGVKFELLEYFLSHGKHVLVEKPLLSPDAAAFAAVKDLARRNGAACYTAYNHRFEPNIARLKDVLDGGALGAVYQARLFYGNGTARLNRQSPWRDTGCGVLPDLGSHLLDIASFLFGTSIGPFQPWSFNRFENHSYDHVVFGSTTAPVLQIEATLLSWRNTFTVDVFAERGTAHIHGLCKWGPSRLTVRHRVLPSGKPDEETQTLECADPTWAIEYRHFKQLCETGGTNIDNDVWINATLNGLAQQAGAEMYA